MASQDNPEQGLCHHASVGRPAPVITKTVKLRSALPSENGTSSVVPGTPKRKDGKQSPKNGAFVEDLPGVDKHTRKKLSAESLRRTARFDTSALEEPSTIDPRSFVQNVFGTVAFKMVEWLTPRNLGILAQSQHADGVLNENLDTPYDEVPSGAHDYSARRTSENTEFPNAASDTAEKSIQGNKLSSTALMTELEPPSHLALGSESLQSPESKSASPHDEKVHAIEDAVSRSSEAKKADLIDSQSPKGIFSKSPRITETTNDSLSPPASNVVQPRKPIGKMPHPALVSSPKMRSSNVVQTASLGTVQYDGNSDDASELTSQTSENQQSPIKDKTEPVNLTRSTDHQKSDRDLEHRQSQSVTQAVPNAKPDFKSPLAEAVLLPQSMSSLSIEAIELLCDIMQTDGTAEQHLLQPSFVDDSLKRFRADSTPLSRSLSPLLSSHSVLFRNRWKVFIEQSFFDTLGKPDSLLRSFSDEGSELLDSQTLWYLLLRMTRVAPSLVFDGLWNAAGVLFRPPEKLSLAYEWAKDSKVLSREPLSTYDAARTVNICLHALIASAPLTFDTRHLANISRIRSYGVTVLGREPSAHEPRELFLQYEDAFTDELAFRLARRLFAAIPTRRHFTELLNRQFDVRTPGSPEPDMLETILGFLRNTTLEQPPVLDFSKEERDFHEKRVPTLILDWARTVILQEWDGSAIVPNDGPLGGALAMIAAICRFIAIT